MNKPKFDSVIHAPNRLQICAFLEPVQELEFRVLKESLEVSDSVLSKHIKTLEEVSYISVDKRSENGRQRTWLSLSSAGRKAFIAHVAELHRIVG